MCFFNVTKTKTSSSTPTTTKPSSNGGGGGGATGGGGLVASLLIWFTLSAQLAKVTWGMAAVSPTTTTTTTTRSSTSPYLIIVDGGSTGSRLHVFEFTTASSSSSTSSSSTSTANNSTADSLSSSEPVECIRLGSARAHGPLSGFADDYSNIVDHLIPAFVQAATLIPSSAHNTTRVLIQATAGMRLIDEPIQQRMYDDLYQQLSLHPQFVFSIQRRDIATLSGDLEGFYGVVAANYLDQVVDAQLSIKQHQALVGALDMGGSSTQIVFLPHDDSHNHHHHHHNNNSSSSSSSSNRTTNARTQSSTTHNPTSLSQTDQFFIHSYLSYGVDQFRYRLWNSWIELHKQRVHNNSNAKVDDNDVDDVCDSKVIENPCVFAGYEIEYEGYTLIGTGQAQQCVDEIRNLLLGHGDDSIVDSRRRSSNYSVDGILHPPVRGKFYAMSNYFYTLDSVRQFVVDHVAAVSQPHLDTSPIAAVAAQLHHSWPTPSLYELFHAVELFCNRSWGHVIEHHDATPHLYTQSHMLPHRCLDATYMITLLHDGFGFDTHSRDITYALHVNDSEVEWTLGMALVLHNTQDASTITTHTSLDSATISPDWSTDDVAAHDERTCLAPLHQTEQLDNVLDEDDEDCIESEEECVNKDSDDDVPTSATDDGRVVNSTTAASRRRKRDTLYLSTRIVLRHVIEFIETASSLDYMHTM